MADQELSASSEKQRLLVCSSGGRDDSDNTAVSDRTILYRGAEGNMTSLKKAVPAVRHGSGSIML